MFTLIFLVGTAQTTLLVPNFLPPHLTGAVDRYFYETSFHSCWKMWILGLGFIYGSCMMVLQHIFAAGVILNVFPEQRRGRCGPTAWLALSPWFQSPSFFFTYGEIWSPLSMLQTLATFRAYNNEYRMHLRWIVRNVELSSDSSNHYSRRTASCIGGQARHFEYFLQSSGDRP